MKSRFSLVWAALAAGAFLTGCETLPPDVEHGPRGTIAYIVPINATPSARIEANGEFVGNTPVSIKIFGNRNGTFHDFGSPYYVIRALPLATNQYPQTAVYATGRSGGSDRIPPRIDFDMTKPHPVPSLSAGAPYYYSYYGPPFYVPPPYWWGPRYHYWWGPGWGWGWHWHH